MHALLSDEVRPVGCATPRLADNVIGAVKIEAYEINEYQGLIRLAQLMGHRKAVQLLKQNLNEEQQTLRKMESFSKKLKPENLGVREEEKPRRNRSRRAA